MKERSEAWFKLLCYLMVMVCVFMSGVNLGEKRGRAQLQPYLDRAYAREKGYYDSAKALSVQIAEHLAAHGIKQ